MVGSAQAAAHHQDSLLSLDSRERSALQPRVRSAARVRLA